MTYYPTAKDDTVEKLQAGNVRLRAALVQIVNAWDGPSEIGAYKKAVENARSVLNPQQ